MIAQQLRELASEEQETAAKLDEAKQLEAKPLSETWTDLGLLLDASNDPDDRRRLRSAISRVVRSINLIVERRGRDQLAAVQVNFDGVPTGEEEGVMSSSCPRRNFLIFHRPAQWVGNGLGGKLRPGRWWAASVKHPDDRLLLNKENLRDPDGAAIVRRSLENYPRDLIDQLLAEDGHPLP